MTSRIRLKPFELLHLSTSRMGHTHHVLGRPRRPTSSLDCARVRRGAHAPEHGNLRQVKELRRGEAPAPAQGKRSGWGSEGGDFCETFQPHAGAWTRQHGWLQATSGRNSSGPLRLGRCSHCLHACLLRPPQIRRSQPLPENAGGGISRPSSRESSPRAAAAAPTPMRSG